MASKKQAGYHSRPAGREFKPQGKDIALRKKLDAEKSLCELGGKAGFCGVQL